MRSDGDHGSRGDAPTAVSAPDMNPSAGATSVNGRARSMYARVRGSAFGVRSSAFTVLGVRGSRSRFWVLVLVARSRSSSGSGSGSGSLVLVLWFWFSGSGSHNPQRNGCGDSGVDEIQHVVVQDTRSFERRAEEAFDQCAGGCGDDDGDRRGGGNQAGGDAECGERPRRRDSRPP